MKALIFSSDNRTNTSIAFDCGKWAFGSKLSWGQDAVDKHMPKGSFGLIYTKEYGLGYPFFTKTIPQINGEIKNVPWPGVWFHPFDIVPLTNKVVGLDELREKVGELNKFIAQARSFGQLVSRDIDSDFILSNLF